MRCEDLTLLRQGALFLADAMRAKFGRRVAGPVAPPIDKIRGQYIVRIMLKIENGRSMARARELLREALAQFGAEKEFKTINIAIDVDAQ
jgi:primosomal protein N' (replication factor Y)